MRTAVTSDANVSRRLALAARRRRHQKRKLGLPPNSKRKVPIIASDVLVRFLLRAGDNGATDREFEAATGLAPETIQNIRRQLTKAGVVQQIGTRGKNGRGEPATVWGLKK